MRFKVTRNVDLLIGQPSDNIFGSSVSASRSQPQLSRQQKSTASCSCELLHYTFPPSRLRSLQELLLIALHLQHLESHICYTRIPSTHPYSLHFTSAAFERAFESANLPLAYNENFGVHEPFTSIPSFNSRTRHSLRYSCINCNVFIWGDDRPDGRRNLRAKQ